MSPAIAWAGLESFVRGAARRGCHRGRTLDRLRALRTRIHAEIMECGWNYARGHFVDRYGGERLDASLLLLPLIGFLPADDPA